MAPTGKTGVRSIQRITRGIPHNGAAKSPRYNTYQAQLMGCEGSGIEWLVEEMRAQQQESLMLVPKSRSLSGKTAESAVT